MQIKLKKVDFINLNVRAASIKLMSVDTQVPVSILLAFFEVVNEPNIRNQ